MEKRPRLVTHLSNILSLRSSPFYGYLAWHGCDRFECENIRDSACTCSQVLERWRYFHSDRYAIRILRSKQVDYSSLDAFKLHEAHCYGRVSVRTRSIPIDTSETVDITWLVDWKLVFHLDETVGA